MPEPAKSVVPGPTVARPGPEIVEGQSVDEGATRAGDASGGVGPDWRDYATAGALTAIHLAFLFKLFHLALVRIPVMARLFESLQLNLASPELLLLRGASLARQYAPLAIGIGIGFLAIDFAVTVKSLCRKDHRWLVLWFSLVLAILLHVVWWLQELSLLPLMRVMQESR